MECGPPAQVPFGRNTLLNGTRSYKSVVRYSCDEGYAMVGRNDLMCDLDQRWNGPPPRCEPLICPDPPTLKNGDYEISERTGNSFTVLYKCNPQFRLVGSGKIKCNEGNYDSDPPECRRRVLGGGAGVATRAPISTTSSVSTSTTNTRPSSKKPVSTSSSTTELPSSSALPTTHYEGGEDSYLDETDQYQHVDGHYPQEPEHEEEVEEDKGATGGSPTGDLDGAKGDKINPEVPDNEVSESNQIVKERRPGVDFPKNVEVSATESSAVARLNIGKFFGYFFKSLGHMLF